MYPLFCLLYNFLCHNISFSPYLLSLSLCVIMQKHVGQINNSTKKENYMSSFLSFVSVLCHNVCFSPYLFSLSLSVIIQVNVGPAIPLNNMSSSSWSFPFIFHLTLYEALSLFIFRFVSFSLTQRAKKTKNIFFSLAFSLSIFFPTCRLFS